MSGTSTDTQSPTTTPFITNQSQERPLPKKNQPINALENANNGTRPIWLDENTGQQIPTKEIRDQLANIYNDAILSDNFQNITDPNNDSIYIAPNTYYYYRGSDPEYTISPALTRYLRLTKPNLKDPQYANRIHQIYPIDRYIMLTNDYTPGTLNPITTQPPPPEQEIPLNTTVQLALSDNNLKLDKERYNILDTQDTLNKLANKVNDLKLKLNSLQKKPMYSASGNLTFY